VGYPTFAYVVQVSLRVLKGGPCNDMRHLLVDLLSVSIWLWRVCNMRVGLPYRCPSVIPRMLLSFSLIMRRLVLAHSIKYALQGRKVRCPEICHLPSRKSANLECEENTSLERRTGSHPAMAGNPSVPQPGLDPELTS